MNEISQFQRYEASHRLLSSEINSLKDDLNELKNEYEKVLEENKELRRDLKESIANQLDPTSLKASNINSEMHDETEKSMIKNLEKQVQLTVKERDDAMRMWQNSLQIISQLEHDLKNLQFQTAPQTMSFELELKKRQEEFARIEAGLLKEISILRIESNHKDEDLMQAKLKFNELKLEMDNLSAQLNQKDQDRRNLIKKEYSYDDALISLQNDINDLETKVLSLNKDNKYLKDNLKDSQTRVLDLVKQNAEQERRFSELKAKYDENALLLERFKIEKQNVEFVDLKSKEEHEKFQHVISELMNEATKRTKEEVDVLKKMYNTNLEKLIEECGFLENERNNLSLQLEKAMRTKRSLEQEIEKVSNENLRITSKENLVYEDLQRRLCAVERDKDQAVMKLEAKEVEFKNLHDLYENDKQKNYEMMNDFREKTARSVREVEKLNDEHINLIKEIDELNKKVSSLKMEKESLQQNLTKQIQLNESEMQIKANDHLNKIRILEENNNRATFELRQLLNMQQRMSNKWKEECHVITKESEAKFTEMKKNFDNLRSNYERLYQELQDFKRKEVENDREREKYINRIKVLESRVKDAESQATEATKRIAKQLAREKMISYEKHLLESDLERSKFVDTFSKGKVYLDKINEPPVRPNEVERNSSLSEP